MMKEASPWKHPLLWFPLKFREPGPTRAKLNVGPGDEARKLHSLNREVSIIMEVLFREVPLYVQEKRGGGGGGGGGGGDEVEAQWGKRRS